MMDDSLSAAAFQLVHDALNPQADRRRSRATEKALAMKATIDSAIIALPILVRADVKAIGEELCSVCYFSYEQKFEDEDKENAQEGTTPVEAEAEVKIVGVTKVEGCGHLFCRECLVEWIQSYHGTCPKCRHVFLEVKPLSDSDDESSDGGEYVPQDDDDEEEEESVLNTDGITEADDEEPNPLMEVDADVERTWNEMVQENGHAFGPTDYSYGDADYSYGLQPTAGTGLSLFDHGRDFEDQLRAEAAASYVSVLPDGLAAPSLSAEQESVTGGLPSAVEEDEQPESSDAGRRRMERLLSGGFDMEDDTEDDASVAGPSHVWYDAEDDGMDVREFLEREWADDDPNDMDYEDDSSECGLTDDASSEAGASSMSESGMTMVDEEELKEEAEYFVRAGSVPDSDFDILNEGAYRYSRDKETDS
ncbi:hypothetical protein BJ165DRAFT_113025 [Panaeolus papilionaceus]|nr:hypothetical protein BJ165DRAFT_113025 [Panaeolus papilionaceus]